MLWLISLGTVVVDVVAAVPALPRRGGDVFAEHLVVAAGGGFNAMAAAARQGIAVVHAGVHGTGPFADVVRLAFAAEGIAAPIPPRAELDTGVVISLVDQSGERTFVSGRGAEATLTAADLTHVVPAPGDVVLVSGYGLVHPPNRSALVPWVTALPAEVLVLVDPGPLAAVEAPDALAAVLARADWCSAAAAEAERLTGRTAPVAAAAALGRAVVRTGSDGCVVAGPGAPVVVSGFVVDALDTNGAGDAHTGVFLAALARGAEPVAAARRANAAAAISVTRRGPATAPTAAETDAFLALH